MSTTELNQNSPELIGCVAGLAIDCVNKGETSPTLAHQGLLSDRLEANFGNRVSVDTFLALWDRFKAVELPHYTITKGD